MSISPSIGSGVHGLYVKNGIVYIKNTSRQYGYVETFDESQIVLDYIRNQYRFNLSASVNLPPVDKTTEPWRIIEESRNAYRRYVNGNVDYDENIKIVPRPSNYIFATLSPVSMIHLRHLLVYCYNAALCYRRTYSWTDIILIKGVNFYLSSKLAPLCTSINADIGITLGTLHIYLMENYESAQEVDRIMQTSRVPYRLFKGFKFNIDHERHIVFHQNISTTITITDVKCTYDLIVKLYRCIQLLKEIPVTSCDVVNIEMNPSYVLPRKVVPWVTDQNTFIIEDIIQYVERYQLNEMILQDYELNCT